MEFILKNELNKTIPKVIDFNFDELKKDISTNLEKYKSVVVTEDTIKEGKEDRARLNSLKTAIDTKRKDVKKEYLKPYNDFENKIKELISLIDEPIQLIDTQIKGFEDTAKNNKWDEIKEFYDIKIGNLKDIVVLEDIVNPKWANITEKSSKICKELEETITKITQDLKLIQAFKSTHETALIDKYLSTHDMSAVMSEKARQEALDNAIKEVDKATVIDVQTAQQSEEETKTIKAIFYATTAAFRAEMKELTLKHNIKYGGIK